MEIETNGSLQFLDVLVTKNELAHRDIQYIASPVIQTSILLTRLINRAKTLLDTDCLNNESEI
jgi:hypothetical protein